MYSVLLNAAWHDFPLPSQDSSARQQPLEVDSCREALASARSCQQMAWKFLTATLAQTEAFSQKGPETMEVNAGAFAKKQIVKSTCL